MRIGSLFSGIGGLDLGLELAGVGRIVWQCEIHPFARAVLKKHWPEIPCYEDVRTISSESVEPVDLLCGGFPCQDVSQAGHRVGLEGARSGLWFEFRRLIGELQPRIVVIENVLGLHKNGLRTVLADLAALGFDAEWTNLAAASVGAPHRRERFFILAYRRDDGLQRLEEVDSAAGTLDGERRGHVDGCRVEGAILRLQQAAQSGMVRGPDGFPSGMDGRRVYPAPRGQEPHPWEPPRTIDRTSPDWKNKRARIFALGNAVAPGCSEAIGRALRPERET